MKIRVGYELVYDFPRPTPMIIILGTHFTRASDVIVPDYLTTSPSVPIFPYRDGFGNWCSRIVGPTGRMRLSGDGVVRDTGLPDVVVPGASQHAVEDLPAETLVFLLGSRYCETDRLSEPAWNLFAKSPPGWTRVQAICDFVHRHIAFGYEHARSTKTAWDVFNEGKGVCRDYAHLAITFCRCMRWRIERDYQNLKQELGLGQYEGRSWQGFHHHATVCIAAYGFLLITQGGFSPWCSPRIRFPQPPVPDGFRPRGAPPLDLFDMSQIRSPRYELASA